MPTIQDWSTLLGMVKSGYETGQNIGQSFRDDRATSTAADLYTNMQSQPQPAPYQPQSYGAQIGVSDMLQTPAPAAPRSSGVPSLSDQSTPYAAMIRDSAARYGIDPNIALRVAKSEGGLSGWKQSLIKKNGLQEPSFGPFQMLVGDGKNFPRGLGNELLDKGIDPRDPRNAQAVIDYAMQHASKNGWGAWYGAAKVGVGNRDGIGGAPAVNRTPPQALAYAGADPAVDRTTPTQRAAMPDAAPSVGGIPVYEPAPTQMAGGGGAETLTGGTSTPQQGSGLPGYTPTQIPAVPSVIAALPHITRDQFQTLMRSPATKELAIAMLKARSTGSVEDAIRAQQLAFKVDDRDYDRAAKERDYAALQGYRQQQLELSTIKAGPMSPAEEAQKIRIAQAGRAQNNVNVDTGGTAKLRQSLDEQQGKSWSAQLDAGTASAGATQDLDLLDELSKQAPQGPVVGRFAQMFKGVNSASDAFQSVISRVAPTLRAPGSGATSDIEYEGMVRSLPDLKNKPEANQAIMGMMRAKAEINVQRAEVITRYQNGEITDAQARTELAGLNRKSIMTPELQNLLKATGEQGDAPRVNDVQTGSDGKRYKFKGGDPSKRENWEQYN